MAEFRTVHTGMWREDEWFQELDLDARLFWIYLFTNPSASVAGIYRLPIRTMAFESGLSVERITGLLAYFASCGKAFYGEGIIWVRKMRDYQLPGKISPQLKSHLDGEIEKIPAGILKTEYMKAYGYPMDTVSIPRATDTDTDTDTHTDTDTDTDTRSATPPTSPAPKARKPRQPKEPKPEPPPDPTMQALPVMVYRDVVHLTPNAYQRQAIMEQVGDDVAALEKWRKTLENWMQHGWKPNNVPGMLESFSQNGRSAYAAQPQESNIDAAIRLSNERLARQAEGR